MIPRKQRLFTMCSWCGRGMMTRSIITEAQFGIDISPRIISHAGLLYHHNKNLSYCQNDILQGKQPCHHQGNLEQHSLAKSHFEDIINSVLILTKTVRVHKECLVRNRLFGPVKGWMFTKYFLVSACRVPSACRHVLRPFHCLQHCA